jgi:hypothetical protein
MEVWPVMRIMSCKRLLASASMGVVVLAGCEKHESASTDTIASKSAVVATPDSLTDDLQKKLVDDAQQNYTPGPEKPAIPVPDGTLDHGDPDHEVKLTAHDMVPNDPSKPAAHLFVGMFHAEKPYKRLGIAKGDNYVLKLPQPRDTLYVMVPADSKLSMSLLRYDASKTFKHDEHKPPQAVSEVAVHGKDIGRPPDELVFGGCVEGSQCPSGHCGFGGIDGSFSFKDYQHALATAVH